ncbi:DUF92 domain-containing protein [Exiguobacterium sp. Helios]|uniref:DUF92 domain-containing protein n=1 Tax=unclassified Exiguobacterium TaxID=2644629 RepID=UPI00104C98C8|nr:MULTISPECIES: DUF92 domain-containing protein [unclassified Exiguobacterium]QNR20484.1 DUF92 domain-containing protein [Exiguobacterium sp. Helios]
MPVIYGILFCFFLGYIGYRLRLLTISGSIWTLVVGALVLSGFGYPGLLMLLLFFGSSSLLSKLGKRRKQSVNQIVEKDGPRDGWQVLANGGIAALASMGFLWTEHTSFLVLFLIVLAASNADTWASEIGPLSKKNPFLLTGRRVPAGTSGAISILGTTATIVGALFIATAGDLLFDLSTDIWLLVTLGGIIGSLFDTLFGGTVQRKFRCVVCLKETEKRLHHNQPTLYVKGWKWLGNDGVNFLSSTLAGMFGFIVYRMW